jgi:hypothetical protein
MPKYSYDDNGSCHWVFPDGKEVAVERMYEHDGLLQSVPDIEYSESEPNHGYAFDLGFLRVTVARDAGELNLQWASLLTSAQRRRAAELLGACSRVEICGADGGFDPEGNFDNISLECADSTFRRKFAAGLRREHSEWADCDC